MVIERFSRGRNCATLTIVILKDGILLFAFPLSTGTRTIANWLNNRAVHSVTFNAKPSIPWDKLSPETASEPAIEFLVWEGH